MTALEIILITYVCISQILSMLILSSSSKNNKKIKIVLFSILNPFAVITAFLMDYIQNRKEKANE